MTRKKILVVLLCVVILAGSGIGGYTLGRRNERAEWNRTEKTEAEINRTAEQPVIAVVNLDSGVTVNGSQVYYGEKIIDFPDENFSYTSLEDARRGMEGDRYGAYIIIPSDFSECVESLNGMPDSAKIQYAITEHSEGNGHSELLQRVLRFGEDLNSQMSYMYLCSIMDEFHSAQDEAVTVMENDITDKAAIEQIQPSDLISMIAVPELVQPENTTRMADLTGYMQKNAGLIETIDSGYRNSLEDANLQLDGLKEDGNVLAEELQILSKSIGEIDLVADETGQPVYQTGIANLCTLIAAYNVGCQKRTNERLAMLGQAETQQQQAITLLEQSIADYNQKLDELSQEQIENYNQTVADQLPKLVLSQEGDPESPQYRLSCEAVNGMGMPPSVMLLLDKTEDVEGSRNREVLNIILDRILSADTASMDEVWKQCDEEQGIAEFLTENHYLSTKDFMRGYIDGNVSIEKDTYAIRVAGDFAVIEQYITDSVKTLDFAEAGLPEFKAEWMNQENETITFRDLMTDIGMLHKELEEHITDGSLLDSNSVEQIVTAECIQPVEDRSEEVKDQLTGVQAAELELLLAYQQSIEEYAPQQTTSFLYENISKMRENVSAMQEEVRQSNQSYMEYADNVYMTAQDNIMLLQDHIREAAVVSGQTVTDALADAQRIKNETSSENQRIMADFASKLPYTRIGSMEYTQAYEFIANPTQMLPVSDYQRRKDEVDHAVAESNRGSMAVGEYSFIDIEIAGYILLGMVILVTLGSVARRHRRRRLEQPAE